MSAVDTTYAAIDMILQRSESVQSATTIISCITQVLLLFVTGGAVVVAYLQYRSHIKRASKEKSFELAQLYSKQIIPRLNYITTVYNNGGITALTQKIYGKQELKLFNSAELKGFYSESSTSRAQLDKAFTSIPPAVYLDAKFCSFEDLQRFYVQSSITNRGIAQQATEGGTKPQIDPAIFQKELYESSMQLLNDLEWFSMHLVYETADESLLYQSLHQSFLSAVKMLYWYIASANDSIHDKYYTNIIALYEKWSTILTQEQKMSSALAQVLEQNGIRKGKK